MKQTTSRRLLFRWTGWFFLTTSIILFLTQLSFLKYLPNFHQYFGATTGKVIITDLFLLTAYVTQASLLAFVSALITLIFTAIFPKRWLSFLIAILLSSLLIISQVIDAIAYSLYHAHEISIGLDLLRTHSFEQVIPLSLKELGLLLVIIFVVASIQFGIATFIWRRLKKTRTYNTSIWIGAIIISCFCFSYGMMASVVSVPKRFQQNNVSSLLLLSAARLVPYYTNIYKLIMPIHSNYQRTIKTPQGWLTYQTQQPSFPMRYPLHPLHCSLKKKHPNILFILVDTWRFDAMNNAVTPNIAKFAPKTIVFDNHWSGGNCTQSGIFSLFYGIPANYWDATIADHQGPVFIKALMKAHYQMAIYASATLEFPSFDENVFVDIKNLKKHTQGDTTLERDVNITHEFDRFLKTRDKNRPFFGFLFYDSAHNYCGGGKNTYQSPFKPAVKQCARFSLTKTSNPTPYLNRYHNALHFIDAEIAEILKKLKQNGLDKNTIIIITGDHGEQFNDEKLGYWSHNSTYSPYQLHIPLLIYWPGKKPQHIHYLSSHYDLVPTLMENVFGCDDPISDYSTGQSLFDPTRIPYLISGNYTNYAVLTKAQMTTFYADGAYSILTPMSRQLPFGVINTKIIRLANGDLNRYFSN